MLLSDTVHTDSFTAHTVIIIIIIKIVIIIIIITIIIIIIMIIIIFCNNNNYHKKNRKTYKKRSSIKFFSNRSILITGLEAKVYNFRHEGTCKRFEVNFEVNLLEHVFQTFCKNCLEYEKSVY